MNSSFDALINTPFGAISIVVCANQLAIELLSKSHQAENKSSTHPLVQQAYLQILQYLQAPENNTFRLKFNPQGSAFQQRVWQAIAEIPLGQTRTYGQLARQLNSGPRAVANACGANSIPLIIPCHRVVAQNGIGGFMQGNPEGLRIKRWLLAHEGIHAYAQGDI